MNKEVTLFITSCGRPKLLRRTLESFVKYNTYPIKEVIVCEDSGKTGIVDFVKEIVPYPVIFCYNEVRTGQMKTIERYTPLVKTPYVFHLEDDWKFFERRSYITDCLDVLSSNHMIGQCLINKNYAEISDDIDIKGGIYHTTHYGVRYYIHEHCKNNDETQKWVQKHGGCKSSNYWPHFSFRPSIIKTNILKDLGEFDITKSHFEMDYAWRYINKGYVSAFLEGIYCLHIGRLTSERDDLTKLNAYALNGECQFEGKEEQVKKKKNTRCLFNASIDLASAVKTFVVNLDNRPDRWEAFQKNDLGFKSKPRIQP